MSKKRKHELFVCSSQNGQICFLWLSLPGHYRDTDEALLAETS